MLLLNRIRKQPWCRLNQGPVWADLTLNFMRASRTLIFRERQALLEALPADPRRRVVGSRLCGKTSSAGTPCFTRKEPASRLTSVQGLDPTKPLFLVLRGLWEGDAATHPQPAPLNSPACNPVLMAIRPTMP